MLPGSHTPRRDALHQLGGARAGATVLPPSTPRRHSAQPTRRRPVLVRAASADAGSDDPYRVLGLSRKVDSEGVRRAYNKKLAENKGNDTAIARIETAHSAIMMAQLSERMKGGLNVDKDVQYADRAVYFPWRPRLYRAGKDMILYTGIAHAVLAAWGIFLAATAGTQPVLASASLAAITNILKQNSIHPVSSSPEASEGQKRQGVKNIVRGVLLAVGATFLGCALFFSLPDFAAEQLGRSMPYWFYEQEKALLAVGTAMFNWITTSFYR